MSKQYKIHEDYKNYQKVSIKQTRLATFCDQQSIKLDFGGFEIPTIRSMDIKFRLEEVTTATIEIIDVDLDLTDIPYDIHVDELCARMLLLRILDKFENGFQIGDDIDQTDDRDEIIKEIKEMTKGMEDIIEMSKRGDKFKSYKLKEQK